MNFFLNHRVLLAVVGTALISNTMFAQVNNQGSILSAEAFEPTTPFDLKRILLDPSDDNSPYLSFGVNLREQYEGYTNRDLGLVPVTDWDDVWFHRLYLNAALVQPGLGQLYVELGNSTILGKENALSPLDQDELYLHQAFAELQIETGFGTSGIRVGRQELSLGSSRLLSSRDGPNVRLSYDGVRFTLTDSSEQTFDVFALAPVQTRPGNFDNQFFDDDVLLWGVYTTLDTPFDEEWKLDAYYLGIRRDVATFDVGQAEETRHTFGVRFFGNEQHLDWNIEPIIQFGEFGGLDIFAWSIGSDLGYTFDPDNPLSPRFGIRANVISGGSSGNTLNTFNALFPNNSYFSEAALFAPSNIIDINPNFVFHPHEDVTVSLMWDFMWRFDTDDAIYSPPGVPIISGNSSDSRFIGHAVSLTTSWQIDSRTTLSAAYTHFEDGPAVRNGGGREVDYFALWIEWEF